MNKFDSMTSLLILAKSYVATILILPHLISLINLFMSGLSNDSPEIPSSIYQVISLIFSTNPINSKYLKTVFFCIAIETCPLCELCFLVEHLKYPPILTIIFYYTPFYISLLNSKKI